MTAATLILLAALAAPPQAPALKGNPPPQAPAKPAETPARETYRDFLRRIAGGEVGLLLVNANMPGSYLTAYKPTAAEVKTLKLEDGAWYCYRGKAGDCMMRPFAEVEAERKVTRSAGCSCAACDCTAGECGDASCPAAATKPEPPSYTPLPLTQWYSAPAYSTCPNGQCPNAAGTTRRR